VYNRFTNIINFFTTYPVTKALLITNGIKTSEIEQQSILGANFAKIIPIKMRQKHRYLITWGSFYLIHLKKLECSVQKGQLLNKINYCLVVFTLGHIQLCWNYTKYISFFNGFSHKILKKQHMQQNMKLDATPTAKYSSFICVEDDFIIAQVPTTSTNKWLVCQV
jgi:hypothetical protein